jgi:iron(III)-enterobactin esterase
VRGLMARRALISLLSLAAAACSNGESTTRDSGARTRPDAAFRIDSGSLAQDAQGEDARDGGVADAVELPDVLAGDTGQAGDATSDGGSTPDLGLADGGPSDTGALDAGTPDAGFCTFGIPVTPRTDPRTPIELSRLNQLETCAMNDPARASSFVSGFLEEHEASGAAPPWQSDEAYVLYRGDATNLTVSVSVDAWPAPGTRTFRNIPNTDLHVARIPAPANARVQYKLTRRRQDNGIDWFTDPINRWVTWDGIDHQGPGEFNNEAFGRSHVFGSSAIRRFVFADWATPSRGDRDVFLQLPAVHFDGTQTMGVLYVHDGNEYLTRANAQAVVDTAVIMRVMDPTAIVYVALPNQSIRRDEYSYGATTANGDRYVAYLADQIVPRIEQHVRVAQMPDQRGTAGASLGGLISLYAAWTRTDVFRKVGSQSGSFFWNGEDLTNRVRTQAVKPLIVYLDSGCNLDAQQQCAGGDNYLENVNLANQLQMRGYTHLHVVDPGAQHEWSAWQRRLPQLLDFLYSP